MNGLGTEGAALAITLILAKIIWDLVKQRKAPGNPHNPLCVERKSQMDRLETKLEELAKEVVELRIEVAGLNKRGG